TTATRGFLIATLVLASLSGIRAQDPSPRPATAAPASADATRQQPAQQPPAPEQPIFRGGINTVRVDVIVTDRQGNPVSDLKLEDFEIQEDGKPQKPETFRLVKIDAQVAPAYTSRTIRSRNDEE